MRRSARVIKLAAICAIVLPGLGACAWWLNRDPLEVIRRPPGDVHIAHDSLYDAITTSGEERRFRDLVLDTEDIGTIRLTTSMPREDTSAPLPVVFILAGLRTGRESLAVVPTHGASILVGFEYPYDPAQWERGRPLPEALRIRRAILDVPSQVVTAARFLRAMPSVDPTRTALLGYSFGALFVPATQRLAMAEEVPFDALTLAYGGVDLRALIAANLRVEPHWLRGVLAHVAATALRAVEPERHLPELDGSFLVIRGARDDRIPAELSARLAALTPEPREVVTLDAGHMGPDAVEVTEQVVHISGEWLRRIGVIER